MKLACLRQRMLAKSSLRSSCRAARLSAVGFASFVAVVLMTSLPLHAGIYWSDRRLATGRMPATGVVTFCHRSSDNGMSSMVGRRRSHQLGDTCGTLSLGSSAEAVRSR